MKSRPQRSVAVTSQASEEEIDIASWVRSYVAALLALDAAEHTTPTQQAS
jgi:hypothetical protein